MRTRVLASQNFFLIMIAIVIVVCLLASVEAFKTSTISYVRKSALEMQTPSSDRANALGNLAKFGSMAQVLAGVTVASTLSPAPAFASKLDEANTKLGNYNLPPMLFIPQGFVPVVSEYGRGNANKEGGKMENPVVVQFAHPGNWVEAKTTINNNGEAGTISANDYIKGDSAFFFTQPLSALPGGNKLTVDNTEMITKAIFAGLTQKGDVTEEFKVLNIRQGPKGVDGQEYIIADLFYKLNTEAGFLITRKGYAALTSVGPFVQSMTAVSTDKRFKKLGETLKDIVESFRVYKLQSGIFTKE